MSVRKGIFRRIAVMLVAFSMMASLMPMSATKSEAARAVKILNAGSVKKLWCGQSKKLKVNARGKVKYKSSNTKHVKVSKKGNVTGVHPGRAKVTVSAGGRSASVKITVKAGGIKSLKYGSGSFTWCRGEDDDDYWGPKESSKGGDYPFEIYSKPYKIYYTDCKFSSSNKSVATVGKTGVVYFKGYGTTTLTVKYGGKKATLKLTIEEDDDEDDEEYDDDDDDYYDDDDDDYYDDDDDDDYYDDDDDYYDDDDDYYDDDDDDDYYDDDDDDDDYYDDDYDDE